MRAYLESPLPSPRPDSTWELNWVQFSKANWQVYKKISHFGNIILILIYYSLVYDCFNIQAENKKNKTWSVCSDYYLGLLLFLVMIKLDLIITMRLAPFLPLIISFKLSSFQKPSKGNWKESNRWVTLHHFLCTKNKDSFMFFSYE